MEGSRLSKERERERASSSSFRASFSPKGRGITQRTARAVTSFLRTVYNVLSTRVASFLAFRCIINEHVSPCTVAHTSDHLPLPRVEEGCAPSSDRQPPFSSRSLSSSSFFSSSSSSSSSRAALSSRLSTFFRGV